MLYTAVRFECRVRIPAHTYVFVCRGRKDLLADFLIPTDLPASIIDSAKAKSTTERLLSVEFSRTFPSTQL